MPRRGSPIGRVVEILGGTARPHPDVPSDPAPVAIFEDLGADALVFDLNFWVEVRAGVEARAVASELRHLIASALSYAGIVIAFPQCDLHIDAARPLPVQLIPPAGAGDPPAS